MSDKNGLSWFVRFDSAVSSHIFKVGEYCGIGAAVVVNTTEDVGEVVAKVTQVDDFVEGCEQGYRNKRMTHLQAKVKKLKK